MEYPSQRYPSSHHPPNPSIICRDATTSLSNSQDPNFANPSPIVRSSKI